MHITYCTELGKAVRIRIAAVFSIFVALGTFCPIILSAETVPQHIVSLSPAATEILCAIGAYGQIAARTDFCDYPPEVSNLPSVGGFDGHTLSLERIVSLRPDFVYASKGMHDQIAAGLQTYGIRVYLSDARSVQSILDEIQDMGRITGHQKQADNVISHISKTIYNVKRSLAGTIPVSVYWEVWNAPYMTAGKLSFIGELIRAAGGVSVFDDIAQSYPVVSEESIIVRNPSVIILSDTSGQNEKTVALRNGWKDINAVVHRRIYVLDSDIMTRPGPRIAEAIEILARVLHPDVVALQEPGL